MSEIEKLQIEHLRFEVNKSSHFIGIYIVTAIPSLAFAIAWLRYSPMPVPLFSFFGMSYHIVYIFFFSLGVFNIVWWFREIDKFKQLNKKYKRYMKKEVTNQIQPRHRKKKKTFCQKLVKFTLEVLE